MRQYQRRYGDRRGRQMLMDEGIVVRPVDKRENYVKQRAVRTARRYDFIEHSEMDQRTAAGGYSGKQYNYTVVTNGTPVNPDVFEDMGVARTIFTTMRLTTRMWNCR